MKKEESKELIYLQELHSNRTITHWIREMGVQCHIFTIQISTVAELENIWESIANEIAAYFQSDFKNEYETWNLYVVFLSDFEISRDLKYKIENDKYSSRKIVIDDISPPIDEGKIVDKILKRIFLLDIGSDPPPKERQQNLSQIIEKRLYSHISKVNLKGQEREVLKERAQIFKEIYKEYSNEI